MIDENLDAFVSPYLFRDAFDGLMEYHPDQLNEFTRNAVYEVISAEFTAGKYSRTNNNQKNYETIQHAIEKFALSIRERESVAIDSWDDMKVDAEDGLTAKEQVFLLERFIKKSGLFGAFAEFVKDVSTKDVSTNKTAREVMGG